MIRDEDGLLTGYVFVDVAGRDISSYVDEASRIVREQVKLPPGYAVLWSGQYEAMARVRARLTYIIPFTVFLVFVLLYLNTRSLAKTAIVLLAVPFSAVGAVWFLLPARLQHEPCRLGRAHRAARRRCRDRRLHAAISRPRVREGIA